MAVLNNQMVHPHDHELMTIPRYVFFHPNLLTMKGPASILEDLSEKIGFHCFIVKGGFRENLQEPHIWQWHNLCSQIFCTSFLKSNSKGDMCNRISIICRGYRWGATRCLFRMSMHANVFGIIIHRCAAEQKKAQCSYAYQHTNTSRNTYILHIIIEGSLEVKLPTIWTDEKQSRAEGQREEKD